jgi:uncharacterized membrane protein
VRPDRQDDSDPEAGSTLPFVLVCWLVAALMVFGAIAASDAFLEQQEVQSICDGAALAAADQADEAVVYTQGVGAALPLTRSAAEAAVADQLADVAFGWLFLGGEALERTAVASARAPTVG